MITKYWYRISNDFTIEKFDIPNLDLQNDTKYWIEVIFNNRIHTTNYSNNEFDLYDYKIYNKNIDLTGFCEGELVCDEVYDRYSNTFETVVCFKIADGEGFIRTKQFGVKYSTREEAILLGIKYMKQFSFYKTWNIIDLIEENLELKKKVEMQNEEINQLKELLSNK